MSGRAVSALMLDGADADPVSANVAAERLATTSRGLRLTLKASHGPLVLPSGDGHRTALLLVVSDGRITRIDAIRNAEKLRRL